MTPEPPPTEAPRRTTARKRILLVLLSLVVALATVEAAVRVLGERIEDDPELVSQLQSWARSGNPSFKPRPYYGWSHHPHNTRRAGPRGFLGVRPAMEKPEGTFRISCLGASTTVRYPPFLREALALRAEGDVEVVNWAVHGWTTAETMTNYFLNVQDYDSDLVLYLHAWNDVAPRIRTNLLPDYTHYRVPWTDPELGAVKRFLLSYSRAYAAFRAAQGDDMGLHKFTTRWGPITEQALLEPTTMRPYLRNVRTVLRHVRASGGTFVLMTLPCREDWREWIDKENAGLPRYTVVGSHQHNEELRKMAREEDVPLIELYGWSRENADLLRPHYRDMIHFNPEGQALKTAFIAAELDRQGLLP